MWSICDMKKNRTNSISQLQLEIIELDKQIDEAKVNGKLAFAKRLSLIANSKTELIQKWVDD